MVQELRLVRFISSNDDASGSGSQGALAMGGGIHRQRRVARIDVDEKLGT